MNKEIFPLPTIGFRRSPTIHEATTSFDANRKSPIRNKIHLGNHLEEFGVDVNIRLRTKN